MHGDANRFGADEGPVTAPPARTAVSSVRVVVVPTATMRRPSARARSIASAAASPISYGSGSTTCASTSSVRTGLKVP